MDAQNDVGSNDPLTWHALYIIGAHELVPIKIGRTRDVWRRIDGMQTGNPYKLHLFGVFFGKMAAIYSLEWHVHKILREFGLGENGEWFSVEPDMAAKLVRKVSNDRGVSVMEFGAYRRAMMEPTVCCRASRETLRGLDKIGAALANSNVDHSRKSK